ncbi:MAG: hypothetical protein ACQGVK_06720 [Myxococcota bacterium]
MRHRRRVGIGALLAASALAVAFVAAGRTGLTGGPEERPGAGHRSAASQPIDRAPGVAPDPSGRASVGASAAPRRPATPAAPGTRTTAWAAPPPRADREPEAGPPVDPPEASEPDDPALDRGARALSLAVDRVDGPSLHAGGLDAAGPRPLVLWRVDPTSGRAAPLAGGASDAQGRVQFEAVPRPPGAVRLVAAPLGVWPGGAGASQALDLAAPPPPAPQARAVVRDGQWRLEAWVGAGAMLLVDHPDEGRFEVRAEPRQRRIALDVAPPRAGASVRLAQRLAPGAPSDWRAIAPFAPTPIAQKGVE